MDKTLGEHKTKYNFSNSVPSRSVHYKQNKLRGGRKRQDRNGHHRRRKIMKDAISHGHYDYILPSSSSQIHNRGGLKYTGCGYVLKGKNVIGCRDDTVTYLSF